MKLLHRRCSLAALLLSCCLIAVHASTACFDTAPAVTRRLFIGGVERNVTLERHVNDAVHSLSSAVARLLLERAGYSVAYTDAGPGSRSTASEVRARLVSSISPEHTAASGRLPVSSVDTVALTR